MVFQESVLKILVKNLDKKTLETHTVAEQLNTNLTDLNVRIEGTHQVQLAVIYVWFFLKLLFYSNH